MTKAQTYRDGQQSSWQQNSNAGILFFVARLCWKLLMDSYKGLMYKYHSWNFKVATWAYRKTKKMKNKKESCESNELILDKTNLFELSKKIKSNLNILDYW